MDSALDHATVPIMVWQNIEKRVRWRKLYRPYAAAGSGLLATVTEPAELARAFATSSTADQQRSPFLTETTNRSQWTELRQQCRHSPQFEVIQQICNINSNHRIENVCAPARPFRKSFLSQNTLKAE